MFPMGDKLHPMVLWTDFITLCNAFFSATVQLPYHTVRQEVRTLSTTQLWRDLGTSPAALFSLLRKKRQWWAFLMIAMVLMCQVRLLVRCTPRYLMEGAVSTAAPSMS